MLGLLLCVWGFCMPAGLLNVFFTLYFLNAVAPMPDRKYCALSFGAPAIPGYLCYRQSL